MSKIPVFVSCPTALNKEQEAKRQVIVDLLSGLQLEDRALGRSDYAKNYPLKEVYGISDVFIHEMSSENPDDKKIMELKQVFLKWYGEVSQKYYEY